VYLRTCHQTWFRSACATMMMMKDEGEQTSGLDIMPPSGSSCSSSADSTDSCTADENDSSDAALRSILSFRPRYLYIAVFFWISVTGGRFLAPFLEHEAVNPHDIVAAAHRNDNNNPRRTIIRSSSSSSSSSSTGMTAETIGLCLAMQVAISTATGSLAGSWADSREERYPGKGRAQVMALGISLASVCFLLHGIRYIILLFLPLRPNDDAASGSATTSTSSTVAAFFSSPAYHFGLRMIIAFFSAFVFPVLDGMTISFLHSHPHLAVEDYGKERLWGAISWAITNMVLAILIDWSGGSFVCFYPLSTVAAFSVLLTLYFFVKAQHGYGHQRMLQKSKTDIQIQDCSDHGDAEAVRGEYNEEATSGCRNYHEPSLQTKLSTAMLLCRLLCGAGYGAAFFLCLCILSSGQAVVDSLIFLYFESLGSSFAMMGVTVVLTVLFEIPIFHIAPTLLKRCGSGALLLLAATCYMIRVLGYSVIPPGHIVYVLLLEPMHGVTYACSQAASVDMAARCTILAKAAAASPSSSSKSELDATGQGLVSAVRGVGSLFGLSVGGWAMDKLGPRLMYRCSAGLVLAGTAVFAVASYFCSPMKNNNSITAQPLPQEDPDNSNDKQDAMGSYLYRSSDSSTETAMTSFSDSFTADADDDEGLEFKQWETKKGNCNNRLNIRVK
jgi:MFS family permease